jgi:hypothetical protein
MASILIYFDEMAHGASPGTLAAVEELYEAAIPSLDQTGPDAMLWETSTPSYQRGQFHTNYKNALARDDRGPVDHRMLMVQLESWEFYRDWEDATTLERAPGRACFDAFGKAVITHQALLLEQHRNPHRFTVERLGHFAISEYAYLYAPKVHSIFERFDGRELQLQAEPQVGQIYVVHVDPSTVRANTGVAVAHAQILDSEMHSIFDDLRSYVPQGPDHEVDYRLLKEDLRQILDRYRPDVLSFDVPAPIQMMQELREYAGQRGYNTVIERRQTNHKRNWAVAENFSEQITLERVHAPYHPLALGELLNLEVTNERVDHPTTGDVITKDLADAMFECVYWLTDTNNLVAQRLSAFKATGTMRGGFMAGSAPSEQHAGLSGWYGRTSRRRIPPGRGGRMQGYERF